MKHNAIFILFYIIYNICLVIRFIITVVVIMGDR